MRGWVRRTSELHGELSALADVPASWWLVAGGAAAVEPMRPRTQYVISDAAPAADTFMASRTPLPDDPIRDAIARAYAARAALRTLDGKLPEQPLAVTIRRANGAGARTVPSRLDVAAFALGDRVIAARLDGDDRALAQRIANGDSEPDLPTPFVCVSIGDEPLTTARHGHRRAWKDGAGPWLGLSRSGDLAIVSTCHLAIDGYGHAWLASRLAEEHAPHYVRAPYGPVIDLDPLPISDEAIPLGIAWRRLHSPAPRALPLAYALGKLLHRAAGDPDARFSPTFQIPVARGLPSDPLRLRRRVAPSLLSLRFTGGLPEPYAAFEARAKDVLAREAAGHGLVARLLSAAEAAPLSLAWKRAAISTGRPKWLERMAEVLGGRACLSRIKVDFPLPPTCAVSSPALLATDGDPLGACVVTVIDDGTHAAITICGSGLAGTEARADALIDELIELL